jgi:hypothetical protein
VRKIALYALNRVEPHAIFLICKYLIVLAA